MQLLWTKDGRKIGNAIIICQIGDTREWPAPHFIGNIEFMDTNKKLVPVWLIETDFGNRARLTDKEIDELYHRGPSVNYRQWSEERFHAITHPSIHLEAGSSIRATFKKGD